MIELREDDLDEWFDEYAGSDGYARVQDLADAMETSYTTLQKAIKGFKRYEYVPRKGIRRN